MQITQHRPVSAAQLADLYRRSGINRPVDDLPRMERMLQNADLLLTAWEDNQLIGAARCFCDYGWDCYLSDLAVDKAFQRRGVGSQLAEAVLLDIGPECQLTLLSATTAMGYYPKLGFQSAHNAFFIPPSA